MAFNLDQIRTIPILNVAERLKIDVRNKKANCFIHEDKTPSMSFFEKKGSFKCFGCGEGGDVVSLVQKYTKMDFTTSCNWLQNNFLGGIETNDTFRKPKVSNKSSKETKEKTPNPIIYEWLINELTLSHEGTQFLLEKGFEKEIIEGQKICDLPNPKTFFPRIVQRWGEKELIDCGLAKMSPNMMVEPIIWDHVILFPFFDRSEKIEYIQFRRIYAKGKNDKFLGLSGIQKPMYNLNCLNKLTAGDVLLICEGITDTISAIQLGHKSIGILGAMSFKEKYLKELANFQIRVIPDKDDSGDRMFKTMELLFKQIGKSIERIRLPNHVNDLNELLRANSRN